METLSTKKLIRNSFNAIIKPHKAFKEIPDNQGINYKIVIPLMFIWGFIFIVLNWFIAQGKSIFTFPLVTIIHSIVDPLFSVGIWLLGSLCFYFIAKLFKKKISLQKIEIAVFYLWVVRSIMPLFDIPHLFGLKMVFISVMGGNIGVHISWIFAFIFIPLLSFFLLKDVLGLKKKELAYCGLISLSIPFLGRFFLEQIPHFLNEFLRVFNLQVGYYKVALVVAGIMIIPLILIRFYIAKKIRGSKNKGVRSSNATFHLPARFF